MGLPIQGTTALSTSSRYDGELQFRVYRAAEAITKGNALRWATTGDSAAGGYDADCLGYMVAQGDANGIGAGIAMEAAAAGAMFRVQTFGVGLQDITTGGSMDAATVLYVGAAGATAEVAAGSTSDADMLLGMVGFGFTTDTSTTGAAGDYFVCAFVRA